MSFDNVRLPASAIADLYRQSLVVLDDVQPTPKKSGPVSTSPIAPIDSKAPAIPAAEPVAQPKIHYTGGFKKQISVVIDNPASSDIPPADFEFLKKMMAACKLTPDDFAIINTAHQPATQQLWQLMPAKAVLLFGVEYANTGIPFMRPHFQVQHWSEAFFMSAPPLSQFLGADTPELKMMKRDLWEGLQKMFLGK